MPCTKTGRRMSSIELSINKLCIPLEDGTLILFGVVAYLTPIAADLELLGYFKMPFLAGDWIWALPLKRSFMIMSPNISGTFLRRGCLKGVPVNTREHCALYGENCFLILFEGTKLAHFSGELSHLLSLCSIVPATLFDIRLNVLILSFRFRCDFRFMGISGTGGISGAFSDLEGSFLSSVVDSSVFDLEPSSTVVGSKSCSMPLSSLSSPEVELSQRSDSSETESSSLTLSQSFVSLNKWTISKSRHKVKHKVVLFRYKFYFISIFS